jgi:hypothetical protein
MCLKAYKQLPESFSLENSSYSSYLACPGFTSWPTDRQTRASSRSIAEHIFNPLNAEWNPNSHFLALLGAHHILHVGRIRVKSVHGVFLLNYFQFVTLRMPLCDVYTVLLTQTVECVVYLDVQSTASRCRGLGSITGQSAQNLYVIFLAPDCAILHCSYN